MQCLKYNFMHVRQNMITLYGNLDVITGYIIDNIVYSENKRMITQYHNRHSLD